MEIDITNFFLNRDASEFSASIAETGYKDIAKRTWKSALKEAENFPLLTTEEECNTLKKYAKDFGAWSDEEIEAWTPQECNALFIQLVSGDIREGNLDKVSVSDDDWHEYEKDSEYGRCSGNIYRSPDDKIYYSLST